MGRRRIAHPHPRTPPVTPLTGWSARLTLMGTITNGTGHGPETLALIQTDDPDALEAALADEPVAMPESRASFFAPEDKRGLLNLAMTQMNRHAPQPATVIALPEGAPFGEVQLDTNACTLCLACVGVCPTGALSDNPDYPMLRFTESACVQCGLCETTCPEDAISLVPQLDFEAWEEPKKLLKQEEPFACISCGKLFGTKGEHRARPGQTEHRTGCSPAPPASNAAASCKCARIAGSRPSSTRASIRTMNQCARCAQRMIT